MENAAEEAALVQGRRCNRRRCGNRRRQNRRRCLLRRGRCLLRQRNRASDSENNRKNDGRTNHRRVKHEKVALSIDHETHLREPDSGIFGLFRLG